MRIRRIARNFRLRIILECVLASATLACTNHNAGGDEFIVSGSQALTATEVGARVLGFEGILGPSDADWVATPMKAASSTLHSEGSQSLALTGSNHLEVSSIPLSTLSGTVGTAINLDVRLPKSSNGQAWKGQAAVTLNAPSLGINSRYLGAFAYPSSFAAEVFNTVSIPIPSDVVAALGSRPYTDLTIHLSFDLADTTQITYVDNLRLTTGSSPPAGSGGATGTGGAGSGGAATAGGSSSAGSSAIGFVGAMSIKVPKGADFRSVALGATSKLQVSDGVVVAPPTPGMDADIASTGTAETTIGSVARIAGDVWSIGEITVRSNGVVTKDAYTQSTFACKDVCDLQGVEHEKAVLEPSREFAWNVAFPVPSGPILIDREDRTVPPGSYSQFSVLPNSTAKLSAGTYYIERFVAERNSVLSIDASAGPVIFYVKDSFAYRGTIQGVDASNVFIGYLGTELANVDAPIKATVVAPYAELRLGPVDGTGQDGSFWGNSILAEARNPIRFVPFAHWDWVIPPKLTVECVARSRGQYGAALLSYENAFDEPITAVEGPSNNVTASARRSWGPLQVFQPGVHKDAFWLPFVGPSIEWNLLGTKVVANDSAPACSLDKLHFVEASEHNDALPPLPQDVVAGLLPRGTDPTPVVLPPLAAPTDTSTSGSTPEVATAAQALEYGGSGRQVVISYSDLNAGSSCIFGEYNVYAESHVNADARNVKIWDGAWSVPAQPIPIIGYSEFFDIPDGTTTASVGVDIWDRHDTILCGDRHIMSFSQTFALDKGGILFDGCGSTDDGWGLCIKVQSLHRPKICAEWPAQYADSGYGEDKAADTGKQLIPASFAEVRVKVEGSSGVVFERDAILDEDGCLSAEDAPSAEQLSSGLNVSLKWAGRLSTETSQPGKRLNVDVERFAGNADPWKTCTCSGEPFVVVPGQNVCDTNVCTYGSNMGGNIGNTELVASDGELDTNWSSNTPNRMMFRFGSAGPAYDPTEYSNLGGIVSQLFRRHAGEGVEMGLVPGTVHIWPQSVEALRSNSPANSSSGTATDRYIILRPEWYTANGNGANTRHESDSHRKFVITHEIAHAIQAMASGNSGGNAYSIEYKDPATGDSVSSDDPPWLTPECRCNQVVGEFAPAHCANSIENVGAALGEGFGHFYSGRLWNDPSGSDCWVPYAKWTLMPACPADTAARKSKCHRVGDAASNALIDKFYTDQADKDYLRSELVDWYFVEGPSRISCAQATRWRNKYCTGLLPGAPDLVGPAVSELGNEMDWMQFYWALTRDTDAWKIPQYFALQREACGGRLCNRTDEHSRHAWKKYEELRANPTGELVGSSPTTGLSAQQWLKLVNTGFVHGVSLDLGNK